MRQRSRMKRALSLFRKQKAPKKVEKSKLISIRPLDYGMKPKQVRVRKKAPKKVDTVSIRPLDYGIKKSPVKVKRKLRKAPITKIKSLKLDTPRRRVRRPR